MPSIAKPANLTFVELVPGAARTSTVTGSGVDTLLYDGAIVVCQAVGTASGTPTLDGKLQDSDTSGGTYGDIAGATFAQVTASNNVQQIVVEVQQTKRWIRYVGTIGGTTPSFQSWAGFVGVKKYQ